MFTTSYYVLGNFLIHLSTSNSFIFLDNLKYSALTGLYYTGGETQQTLILTSFGASVVLLYCAPKVPFSQPYNVIVGHSIGAGIGVLSNLYLSSHPLSLSLVNALTGVESVAANHLIAAPVAVSLSCMAMMMTKSIHPPAGGTALATAVGIPLAMGFDIIPPTLIGSSALIASAYFLHLYNHGKGFYPTRWGP
jgi:CBS domain-containing membrane protein